MERRHAWPDGHWNWPIRVTHKHGVRCGEMVWVGGQVDLTPDGVVCNPGDLAAQTKRAMAHFARVLEELDCDPEDLVTLLCFYVNDGGVDEAGFLAAVGECLPPGARPAVTAVPVPYLAYDGLQVEIEGYAMRRENGERTPRTFADASRTSPLPPPFCQGVRSGRMIFVSAQ
ncbi:MAG: RidA family protein, partial [Chromatiales bacterium]|nr:RidA family protein [Chromatiales bacterium]